MTGRAIIRWTLLILLGLLLMAVVIIGIRGCQFYKSMTPYLSSETIILPKTEYSENDGKSIETTFHQLKNYSTVSLDRVFLDQKTINYIITEKLIKAKRIFIALSDNTMHVMFTLPFPFTNKFLNGSMDMLCSYDNDTLSIDISELRINNTPIEDITEQTIETFAINYFYEHPRIKDFLQSLESLTIANDTAVFKFKPFIKQHKEPEA
ncbi:hypothetical protein KDK77_10710 [bacterium]|nr:hypothetical protein [bacterium]MCP5462984.1 hypothetical protein [bacterium]